MDYPKEVTIIEVGPRDGLQNEKTFVKTEDKIAFINQLSTTGLTEIEVTSFVSKKAIPQLVDANEVIGNIHKPQGVTFSALVPNIQGMQDAIQTGIKKIALFTSASETFNQRNIHCSIQTSLERFKPVIELAKQHHIEIRAYVSCVLGCPYEGDIKPKNVATIATNLLYMGVDEISLGDTIGVGTPRQTHLLLKAIQPTIPTEQLAMHFHNTYGQAIANIVNSLEAGIRRFDSSVAGLGGCPYARGATGNVATEDILYLLHGLGIHTGIDIFKMVRIGHEMCQLLNRKNQSHAANALLANA